MTFRTRLTKLEPPTKENHQVAWGRFWRLYRTHLEPVFRASRRAPAFAALIMNDDDSVDWTLPESPLQPWVGAFDEWHLAACVSLPDPDTVPDLRSWPADFPSPPAEPPELWDRLWGYLDDPATQACAGVALLNLASARAVRDYRQGTTASHTQGGLQL